MTIVVPERKCEKARMIARSPKKRLLNKATKAVTGAVKKDSISDVREAIESSHPLPDAVTAQVALQQSTKRGIAFTMKNFKICTIGTSFWAARIFPRVWTCYCAILRELFAASRSLKIATMMFLMKETWKLVANFRFKA